MFDDVWIAVLAAGISSRMGTPKQLLPVAGECMICHVVRKALMAGQVAVVLGGATSPVQSLLTDLPAVLLHNPDAYTGMSSSLHTAIRYYIERKAQAAVILLGDQPGIEPAVVKQVIEHYVNTNSRIVQAHYTDRPGHPVLFDRSLFPDLLQVTGDRGAKQLLEHHRSATEWVHVPTEMPADLDTPEEYKHYLQTLA
jgi:molybdenum cofactor cytidylyltransferase